MSTLFVGLASKLSLNPDHRCVACNDKIMDGYGHHVSVCAVKGDRIKRHKLIRDIIIDCCYTLLGLPYLHMSLSKTTPVRKIRYSMWHWLVHSNKNTCMMLLLPQVLLVMNLCAYRTETGCIYLPFLLETFGGYFSDVEDFIIRLSSNVGPDLKGKKTWIRRKNYETISCVLMKS